MVVVVAMVVMVMVVVVVVVLLVMMVAAVMIEVALALVDVFVSSGMILCLQKARFYCFLKKRNGHTDGHTDGRTDEAGYRVACSRLKK